jgi:hypothetical protein
VEIDLPGVLGKLDKVFGVAEQVVFAVIERAVKTFLMSGNSNLSTSSKSKK